MDVVLIANFCGNFSSSDNNRFLYLANLLSKYCKVELITSSFQHEMKEQRKKQTFNYPFTVTIIDEPGYPRNICLKRFFSHHIWGKNVQKYLENRTKPGVVYCAVPSLSGPNTIAKYCERNHIPFVIDIQDLWPEAFQMIVNIPIVSQIGFIPFTILANGIYRKADSICAVSDTYCQRALRINKKCKVGTTVYLGTNLETFDRYAGERPIMEKGKDEIWLAYCGTLGSSYDLMCVVDALAELNVPELQFVVMGDGPRLQEFEDYAKKKEIRAIFTGRLQYNHMCSLLAACDITVNPITPCAAQSIINKHADYVAAGLPIVSTQENEEFRKLVDNYHMGFNCESSDAADLAEKIKILVDDEKLRNEMGRNARRCAEEKFDRASTYHLLCRQILGMDM